MRKEAAWVGLMAIVIALGVVMVQDGHQWGFLQIFLGGLMMGFKLDQLANNLKKES